MAEAACQLTIRIELESAAYAEAVARALEVDNSEAPRGLTVSCADKGSTVVCDVRLENCNEPSRLLTLRNTADDLLLSARAAIEGLSGLQRRG